MFFSTTPLRFPRLGGHGAALTPQCLATGPNDDLTLPDVGLMTVAIRSTLRVCPVPPNRRRTRLNVGFDWS